MNVMAIISYIVLLLILIYAIFKSDIKSLMFRGQKFRCNNCTKCCKLKVRLYDKDLKRIKTDVDYIQDEEGKKWIKSVNNYCIFLKIEEGRSSCSIYNMRPDICRRFPERQVFGIKCNDSRCSAFNLPKFMKYL